MELQLHLHHWRRRQPDWAVAAVAGFAASALLMVLELLWGVMNGSAGPWRVPELIAALVLGPDALRHAPDAFNLNVVIVALGTHYVLGIMFGCILGYIIAGFQFDSSAELMIVVGAAFGALLYAFNFHGIAEFFTWLPELRGMSTFIAHLIFGITAAMLYWALERRSYRTQPVP